MYTDFNQFLLLQPEMYDAWKWNYACHFTFIL